VVSKKEITASPHQRFLAISSVGTANYGDLDLGKAEDVTKLRTRISDTAKSLCKQLEQKYPVALYVPVTNLDCVKTATDDTMEIVNLLASAYRRL
jgi:UrcA family protein